MRLLPGLWLLIPVIASAAVDPDLPSPAPVVRGIFPHGVQRGASAEVEISGQNLHETSSIEFAGRGVRAEILSALGAKLKLKVTADATAEVGRRDFRLTTGRGVYVGVFDIGALPEVLEKEGNDDFRKPQPINLPVLVNGMLGNEDWDHFRFHASAGETLIFDVSATRHGSRLDSDVAVLDGQGLELAWTDDTSIFGDPHLTYMFEKSGEYIVRVGSLAGGGDYRLAVGRLPYVSRTFPAGLTCGRSTVLTLSGTHLDLADEVWIGDRAAKGQIIRRSPSELQVRFGMPAKFPTGPNRLHVSMKGFEIAIPTEIRVSSLPEVTVTKAPASLSAALAITPTVVLNGIIDQPKAIHYFHFTAKAGDRYTFRSESMKLGYHLDPALTLFDSRGKKLAYADDPGVDERSDEYQLDVDLSYTFTNAGEYYVAIRDGMHRGGDQLVYRLTAERMQPDFIVEVREPSKSLYEGQEDTIQVRVRRRAGWNAPVDVWAEGLPPQISVDRQTVAPVDSVVKDTCGVDRTIDGTIALLKCRVGASAGGHFAFKIKARGVMEGVAVERDAIVRYQNLSAGYVYGPMQMQRSQVTVTSPPAVIISTPEVAAVTPGSDGKLKLTVRRFGSAKTSELLIRAKQLPSGVTIQPLKVPATENVAQLVVSASPQAVLSPITLEVVSPADGRRLGESAPFLMELKSEAKSGK
jgi:hypothetical protein